MADPLLSILNYICEIITNPRGKEKSDFHQNLRLFYERMSRNGKSNRDRLFQAVPADCGGSYFAVLTLVMWGFTPSYQYRKPSRSILSPICRAFTALYTSESLSHR